ncbi:MAG TPA: hypothetical protein VFQ44_27175 [Streptosporangiaceae bacterium]|nr:hypothetical protein [Streptosporangiaceae bacterium]
MTTKADVYGLTGDARSWTGPVYVFNPQRIGGVESTIRWSPVAGCEDPATAIRRADAFANAVSRKGIEDATFWSNKASDYLRAYFHAAALAGEDLRTVAGWVAGASPGEAEQILISAGAGQRAMNLTELTSEAQKTVATVRMVMSRALSFMADPALAASVLPEPGQGFAIGTFLADRGTLYMIAEPVTEDAPVAPLFAAASKLCGQAAWKIRGDYHKTWHDVATPDMIRQLPAGYALVIRGGCAPVIARLPRAWNNPAYHRARRTGRLHPLIPARMAITSRDRYSSIPDYVPDDFDGTDGSFCGWT